MEARPPVFSRSAQRRRPTRRAAIHQPMTTKWGRVDTPVSVSRGACFCQLGRASVPDDAAAGADHPRSERGHRHVIGPLIGAQDRPVVRAGTTHQATTRRWRAWCRASSVLSGH
jgi:hypothetical protein